MKDLKKRDARIEEISLPGTLEALCKLQKIVKTFVTLIMIMLFIAGCGSQAPIERNVSNSKQDTLQLIPTQPTIIVKTNADTDKIAEQTIKVEDVHKAGPVVVIDAGHQRKGDNTPEPIGPGSSKTKISVSTGTCGVASGINEYELTLEVALKLQDILQSRGYQVIMTRTTHDVNISNKERAEIANKAKADVFIRIHADGSNNPKVNGATALCQTKENPFNGEMADQSYALSKAVIDELSATTGCKNRGVTQTDTMSGINWSKGPVTIVELGFMTNPDEDTLMATQEYQQKMAEGLANGIDLYFKQIGKIMK